MSGDPLYHFHRASRRSRPLWPTWFVPFRSARSTACCPASCPGSSTRTCGWCVRAPARRSSGSRWTEREQLSETLWRIYVPSACGHGQGALAQMPRIHSGLPEAAIKDLRCMMHGDPYCEWEFTWRESARQGARPAPRAEPCPRPPAPQGSAPRSPRRRPSAVLEAPLAAYTSEWPAPPAEQMAGPPFGADEAGRPITHVKGPVVRGSVEFTLVVWRSASPPPSRPR